MGWRSSFIAVCAAAAACTSTWHATAQDMDHESEAAPPAEPDAAEDPAADGADPDAAAPGGEEGDDAPNSGAGQEATDAPTDAGEAAAAAPAAAEDASGNAAVAGATKPADGTAAASDDAKTEAPEPSTGEVDEEMRLDLAAHLGVAVRLDDPPWLEADTRAGLLFGLGLDLAVIPALSIGVRYEHVDLGDERSGAVSDGSISVSRDVNSLWLQLRAFPLQSEDVGGFITIGGGLMWQSADATGVAWRPEQPGISESFTCEGSDSASLGLRAALGVDARIVDELRMIASAGMDHYQLSDEPLDSCAPGGGSAIMFGLRVGLAYGIDL